VCSWAFKNNCTWQNLFGLYCQYQWLVESEMKKVPRAKKKFALPQTPLSNFNQLEMVTTFTYKPSLVKIDARNFELSW